MKTILPDSEITNIKSIGPKRAEVLQHFGIKTYIDLLYHFPRRYLDRSNITSIAQANIGDNITIVGEVVDGEYVKTRKRGYYQVTISDDSGVLKCIWFNGAKYIQRSIQVGEKIAISGKLDNFNGPQIVHPDYDRLEKQEFETLNTARIIPLYSSTAELKNRGFDSRGFRRIYGNVFEYFTSNIPEILPESLILNYKLMSINEAIRQIHFPDSIDLLKQARARFKFEELFYLQLLLAVKAKSIKAVQKQFKYSSTGKKLSQIYEKLPFDLTDAQKKVVHEIWDDMKKPEVMNRLIQGDVGSGKTVVALLVASIAISNGYQAAVMAPTEILAEQHFRTLCHMGKPAGINVCLLVGGQRKKEREEILENIRNGKTNLIVGTHAIIQDSVEIDKLSLAIIDEQHRFGVEQRSKLIHKGLNPDVLVMTATPIPRTMSMTLYGDMDISIIDKLPAKRGKITTKLVDESKISKVYQYTKEQIQKGDQVYIVYPLIEKSEKMDLKAAVESYEYLKENIFKEFNVALLHGSMKSVEKEEIMQSFGKKEIDILVSTTVIEVGVDNPNATIMIIENAERFGLTQIHQLRGRIGRGKKNSVCVLVERKKTETSMKRLKTLLRTTNGFEISEEDLKLRGPGEFYGTKQHGFPKMKIADLIKDHKLMAITRGEAKKIIEDDTQLRRAHNQNIRNHLLKNYAEYMEFVDIL